MKSQVKYRCAYCKGVWVTFKAFRTHPCKEREEYRARLAAIPNDVPAPAGPPR